MITIRKASERGHFDFGWLDTYHSFSFGDYHDPRHMGFRSLRVINEDRVAPGEGFPTHGHRDMEIVTVILEGALEHRDSLGTGSVIRPGDVQRMTAGTGVRHSEYNPSPTEPVHLLQIWLHPDRNGLQPGYEQKAFQLNGGLTLLASPDGRDGSVTIHQDALLYRGQIGAVGRPLDLDPARHAWIQVTRGDLRVNGHVLKAGDGAAVSAESHLQLEGAPEAEVLVFDLA